MRVDQTAQNHEKALRGEKIAFLAFPAIAKHHLANYGNAVYVLHMQTVAVTPTFERQAKALKLDDAAITAIATAIAEDPMAGDVMAGTGGARKVRHAREGQGKSGGYRTIHYFGGDDVPVFLLSIIDKTQRANLSKAERNELATILPKLADAYRASSTAKVINLEGRRQK